MNKPLKEEIARCHNSENDWVDLGLLSGTLWATCNIGADSPEKYGYYLAWGETTPKNNSLYNWRGYAYAYLASNQLTKYCSNSNYGYDGFTDSLAILEVEDDPATNNWGSAWRTPTHEQWEELLNQTTNKWTTLNGVYGRLFTASNGNNIFLPAAGNRWGGMLAGIDTYGNYWSNSLYTGHTGSAYDLSFSSDECGIKWSRRGRGQSIRPVREN